MPFGESEMREIFPDAEVDAKYETDCEAADVAYKASKGTAYEIYWKAMDDAYDTAKAAQRGK
jgi:hypothetical protein